MLLHIPLFCPCKVAKTIDFIHTDSCSYLFGKEPSIFLGALTRAELNWLQSGVKARPAFSFTSLAHCSVHFAPPCLHRSAQHRSVVFRAGPDRLLRMCEKDLGENICNQGINALRTSPSPLILQEAPRGLGRAEQRWRNARKRARLRRRANLASRVRWAAEARAVPTVLCFLPAAGAEVPFAAAPPHRFSCSQTGGYRCSQTEVDSVGCDCKFDLSSRKLGQGAHCSCSASSHPGMCCGPSRL